MKILFFICLAIIVGFGLWLWLVYPCPAQSTPADLTNSKLAANYFTGIAIFIAICFVASKPKTLWHIKNKHNSVKQ